MQRMTFVWLLLGVMVTSCFKSPIASQGTVKHLGKDKASGVTTEVSSTKSIAAVDSQAKEDVVLAVSGTGNSIAGTSISIAPGSLSISTSIIIEQGADLRDTSMTEEVTLTDNTSITQAGSGVIVRPSTSATLQKPITLNLPLPVTLGLLLAGDNYAVYYKYLDPASNQLLSGFRVVDGVDVKLVYDESQKADVIQFEGYFGAYWIVKLSREIPKSEVPPAKVSIEPIANKANTQVFASTGAVVEETKVVAVQAKPEVMWKKPSLQLIPGSVKAVLTAEMSSVITLKSCKADIFESPTSNSGRNLDTGKDTTFTFPLNNILAHKIVGRFRCLDSESRVTISPWTDSLAVEAYKVVSITGVKAAIANGSYTVGKTIPIAVSYSGPVRVQGTPLLTLETGAVDRNAIYKSGSGTDTLTFEYLVQQGDESAALNYSSISALSLLSSTMLDPVGVAVSLRLPELDASVSLAGSSAVVIDSKAPDAPTSVGFSSTTSSSSTFSASWSPINDSNLKGYNSKICGLNDCATDCQSIGTSVTNSATFTAVGSNGPFYACVQSEDKAGNLSAYVPSTQTLTVVSSGPVVTSVSATAGNYGLHNTFQVDVNFSAPVTVTGSGIQLLLNVNAAGRAANYLSGSGTSTLRFTYTTYIGDNTLDLNYKSISSLSLGAGEIKSNSGANANLVLPSLSSPQSLAGSSAVVIDTTPPTAPIFAPLPNNNYLTSVLTALSGTSEANATIKIKAAGNLIGTGAAVGTGWTVTLSSPLADGTYNVVAYATDSFGNVSADSALITLVVRTSIPPQPVISSLVSPTLVQTPVISGTAEANAAIKVFANGTNVGTTIANASGQWTVATSTLIEGTYQVTAKAFDPALRESLASSSLEIKIDTANPVPPSQVTFTGGTVSNNTSVQVNWTNSTDNNFKTHNLKLCSNNACSTGCTTASTSVTSPASLLGSNGSTYYACVQGEDLLGHKSSWVPSAGTMQIDSTNATVTDVTSSIADGYYGLNTTIDITVSFSKIVIITSPASLSLVLETGSNDRAAAYISSTATSITFRYTVQAGDTSADLSYQSPSALALNGATINDAANNAAVLLLPAVGSGNSLAGQKAIVIDTTSPTSPTALSFLSPYSKTSTAPLSFGNGTDANFSTHNVKLCPSNNCSTGCLAEQTAVTSPVSLAGINGSTYYGCAQSKDLVGLMSPWVPSSGTVRFDTTAPAVLSVSSNMPNGSYKAGFAMQISVTFSEAVTVFGGGDVKLLLETGSYDRAATYLSGSGSSTLIFDYTVGDGDTSADLDYQSTGALIVGTGRISDMADNNANLNLPVPGSLNSLAYGKALVIDTTLPAAPVILAPASGYYSTTNVASVSGTSEANAQIMLKNNDTLLTSGFSSGTSWAISPATPLADGNHVLTAYAVDAAGNVSASSSQNLVTVDTTAPTACVVNVGAAETANPSPTISGHCEPNLNFMIYAGSEVVATGTTDSSGNFSRSISFRPDGTYQIAVRATDPGLRVSQLSNIYSLTINTAPPVILNVSEASPMYTNIPANISPSVTGAVSYAWTKVSGIGTLTFSNPSSAATSISASVDGSYVARLTATSSTGISASRDITVIWDTTSPSFEGITEVRRSADNSTAWLYWKPATDLYTKGPEFFYELCWNVSSCIGVSTVQGSVSGSTYDYKVSGLNPAAVYHFAIRAKDRAGNVTSFASEKTNGYMPDATGIAAGNLHSCAIVAGIINCWGANSFGQLGNGNNMDSSQPITPTGLSGLTALKVVVGGDFSCAIFDNGKARCWGRNDYGQLGQGTKANNSTPNVDVALVSSAVDIEAGSHHACAKTNSGSVYCWGYNAFGQIGDQTNVDRSTPYLLPNLSNVLDIGLGSDHSCAVLNTGSAYCWGLNTNGQLGDGTIANRNQPVLVNGYTASSQIDGGADFTCGLLNNAAMMCWGGNNFGQLGSSTFNDSNVPVAVSSLSSVTDFSVGLSQVCAKAAGTTYCWGNNEWGQFGNGSINGAITPTAIPDLSLATNLTIGNTYACALFSGSAKCWGGNLRGQLGVGAADIRLTPVVVQGVTGVNITGAKIASGYGHTCSISGTGVVCWGNNKFGQLGNNSTVSSLAPVAAQISGTPKALVAGDFFTCALLEGGGVQCWGQGTVGQLGFGDSANSSLPRPVSSIQASKLTAAGDSACALLTSQKIVCWGKNIDGNLGDGTIVNRPSPTIPTGTSATNFIDIAMSPRSTCAVLADNSMKCWGANNAGQLGDKSFTNRLTPTPSILATSIAQVAAGNVSTCVVLLDQTVRCWGDNAFGQLGNGNTMNSSTVAQSLAGGVVGVTAIMGSRGNYCVTAEAGVKCWGNNESGNLGSGNLESQSTPSEIKGIGKIENISVGPVSTCFTHMTNRVSCVGKGYYGAFGETTPYYWTPTTKVVSAN
jgi:alpha-tubulin suppressor-like RCC1 family protein